MAHSDPSRNLTFKSSTGATLVVMVGDNPPSIQGGYANWTTIPRPLLRGVTVFQGYDPVTMKVEVRFGVWKPDWRTGDGAGRSVEADITTLEEMASSSSSTGPSPYVYASSPAGRGGTTSLIPANYQQTAGVSGPSADKRVWPWVISGGIQWGNAIRNQAGYRVWQDATFTLMNYQSFSPPATHSEAGGYFTSGPGRNTPLLIADANSSHSLHPEALANAIKDSPKNEALKLRSIRSPIKQGRHVWVPTHSTV